MSKYVKLPELCGKSPWFELSRYREHKFGRVEDLRPDYDFVIVGAGFGGVFAAFRLTENNPSASVLLVDANQIGTGSSGRNAGFVQIAQIACAIVGNQKFTLRDQQWLVRMNTDVVTKIGALREEHKLEFEWRRDGMYKAVREQRNQKHLDELAGYFDELGIGYERVDGPELCARLGTEFYKKSLFSADNYLHNPSETIRGLATALPENVLVLENSPVLEVKDGAVPSVVLANGREIKAGRIILTVNAYLKDFYPREAANVTAIHSFGALTRPLAGSELDSFKNVQPWGITGTHPAACTVRYTPDHRLFVRTDIAYAKNLNINPERMHKAVRLLKRAYDKRFPSVRHVEFEYIYGGLISFTGNTMPFFGEVARNVVAGVSGEGSGVTRASILGHYLADLLQGVDSDALAYIKTAYRPNYLPPDPFRTVGARGAILLKNIGAGTEL